MTQTLSFSKVTGAAFASVLAMTAFVATTHVQSAQAAAPVAVEAPAEAAR